MPPSGKLGANDLEVLQNWASEGVTQALGLVEAVPSYYGTIKPIIDQKCAWCHSATAKPTVRETPYLTTYALVSGRSGDILDEMNNGKMPPRNVKPELTAGELAAFRLWIDSGKPEGTVVPFIAANVQPGYTTSVNNLLSAQCTGCHSAVGGQLPDLSSFATAKSAASSSYAAMAAGRMPPGQSVSPANLTLLKQWIDANFPAKDGDPAVPVVPPPAITPLPAGAIPGYNATLATWFNASCVSCHSAAGKIAPNLEGYDNAKLGAARSLISRWRETQSGLEPIFVS